MSNKPYEWTKDGSIPKIGEHSLAKHRIIEDYVDRYIKIVTANPRQRDLKITVVDGFCGGGLYSDGNGEVPGSPIILLNTIRAAEAELSHIRQNGFKINADFFFVDKIFDHSNFLKGQILSGDFKQKLNNSIKIYNNDFEEVAPEIIKFIKSKGTAQRSLFLLDQYGWSGVPFKIIRQIFSDLANPEILLTFSVDYLIDNLNEDQIGSSGLLSIDLKSEDVRQLLDLKDQVGWRGLIQNDLYRHIQKHTGAPYYTCFFIKSPESHRSYWFLHLSTHVRARDEMATLHWEKQNHFVHHGRPGFQALGFDPSKNIPGQLCLFDFDAIAEQQSINETMSQIPMLIRDDKKWTEQGATLEEIFIRNCNESPVTKKIVEKAFLELRRQREINIVDQEGTLKPRAKSLSWEDRLVLPKQRKFFELFK